MSSYLRRTKHPNTGEFLEAEWMDDFYGRRRYGVKFPNDEHVYRADDYDFEFDDQQPEATSQDFMQRDDIPNKPSTTITIQPNTEQIMADIESGKDVELRFDPPITNPAQPNPESAKDEVDEILRKFAGYVECDEWHIHDGDKYSSDGHMLFDGDKAKAAITRLIKRKTQEAYERGYKQGVTDEIKCIETSGEHAQLKGDTHE